MSYALHNLFQPKWVHGKEVEPGRQCICEEQKRKPNCGKWRQDPIWQWLRLWVCNFGDGDSGASEIHARMHARNFEETQREGCTENLILALLSGGDFRGRTCISPESPKLELQTSSVCKIFVGRGSQRYLFFLRPFSCLEHCNSTYKFPRSGYFLFSNITVK